MSHTVNYEKDICERYCCEKNVFGFPAFTCFSIFKEELFKYFVSKFGRKNRTFYRKRNREKLEF